MISMSEERYIGLIRTVAAISAVGMWLASIQFSVDGFNFNILENSTLAYFLGFAVTAIQLVWNREANSNWTIMVVGLLAYTYGIYTNFIGIQVAQSAQLAEATGFSKNVFPFVLGLFLEITPEALLVWALTGVADIGDFLGNIIGERSVRENFRKDPKR